MNIDALGKTFSRLKDAIIPGDPAQAERLRYIINLTSLSNEELEEALYAEQPDLRPSCSRSELIQSFLSIDIDDVPVSLLRPDEQLGRVDYNDLLINRIQCDRVDAVSIEALQRWHQWKQQVYCA